MKHAKRTKRGFPVKSMACRKTNKEACLKNKEVLSNQTDGLSKKSTTKHA